MVVIVGGGDELWLRDHDHMCLCWSQIMEEILERSLSEHSRSELGYWRQLNRRDEPGSNRQEIQGFRQMGKRGDSDIDRSL
ncbi:hypothetical protein HanRHA438_Chr16g0769331 [Helianthus annuus]|nr:hypothetical protein HanRHA438_Chr16g0769331 [Helianthus annuus]